ncbi:AbrB family transcriptional regulator [Mangrovibacter yixingensis]|uniref:AbrB family transcriptional regulator n=1 Tax=Mangrovibacter yixingensis TaxID=1529639 RepID=UPI001CFDDB14|nr:AbrB family transcriptional regulator [Mangrovibacter yixingensis]
MINTPVSLARWCGLVLISALLVLVLEAVQIPAALLLGPMFAAIGFAASSRPVSISRPLFHSAQAVVGAMIAAAIPPDIFNEIAHQWPLFLACVVSVIVASLVLGGLLARYQVLPGSTAIWGSSPGAATAMTLMAESFGADVRLVAFMQYLRVMVVALVATLVTRLWVSDIPDGAAVHINWFVAVPLWPLCATLLVIAGSVLLARCVKLPAGPMLLALVLATVAQDAGGLVITLPETLLALAYAFVGWGIGLRFSAEILRHAAHALPRVLLSVLTLVAVCAGFAWLLVRFAGIDPLTAYLATSPGGADSVAIIASSSHVDLPFVMAMQTGRFILVMLTGPVLSRWIANWMQRRAVAR